MNEWTKNSEQMNEEMNKRTKKYIEAVINECTNKWKNIAVNNNECTN